MLDGAGYAHGHIELRRDDLAGLPHLPVVGGIARIDRRAAGAHRGAEFVGQRGHHGLEVFLAAQAAPAGDDDLRRGEFRPLALGGFAPDQAGQPGIGHGVNAAHLGRAAGRGHRVEARGAHGDDLDLVAALHRGNGVASVDGAIESIGAVHMNDVGNLRHIEQGRHARGDVFAEGRGRRQDVAVGRRQSQHLRSAGFRQARGELRRVGAQHLAHASSLRGSLGNRCAVLPGNEHMHLRVAQQRGGNGVEGGGFENLVVVFGNDECGHGKILEWVACGKPLREGRSDDLGLGLQTVDQRGDIGHLHARAALGRLGNLQRFESRAHIHAQFFRLEGINRLFLRLHDVGQSDVARLVEPQVGGDDGGQLDRDRLQSAIHLAGNFRLRAVEFDLGRKGSLRPAQQSSQHLPGLVGIVIDGLLAQNDQLRTLFLDHSLEQLGHGQGLQLSLAFHQHTAVGADRHGGAQGLAAGGYTTTHRDDLGCRALFLEPHRFFHGDFVKRVHAHLHTGGIDAAAIRLDPHLDVVIHHALDRDQHFHAIAPVGFVVWVSIGSALT